MSSFALNHPALELASACADGRHIPSRGAITKVGSIQRTVCRQCRCPLMRTEATRMWFRSGMLG